jgi:hypothetical protein
MEAAAVTGVACSAYLFYLDQERITIAIDINRMNELSMARCCTFLPELITAAREVSGFSSSQSNR